MTAPSGKRGGEPVAGADQPAGGDRAGMSSRRRQAEGRVAVVDIGSNSVRLVVYDTPARLPVPIFNEKAECGLVRGLEQTGHLNGEGIERARVALTRFVNLAKSMDVERLALVATAAVRDATDGLQFVDEIETTFGVTVQVPSGAEEARLAALGLLIGVPKADGLLGDLGGGSLDLVGLDNGDFGANASLPLGHIRLADTSGGDLKKALKIIDGQLADQPWLRETKGRTLYAVGGSWRALARLHIEQSGYPLHIIDGFTIGFSDARDIARVISHLSPDSLRKMESVSRKRADTLSFAALAMERLLEVTRPDRVVYSGFGMREGEMIKGLPPAIRAQDPLIAGCETLAERSGRFSLGGVEAQAWMMPLFAGESDRIARLRFAACLLSDIGWTEHPDYRAEHAFYRVLRLPYAGLTHPDRALLAMAVFVRYNGDPKQQFAAEVLGLLTDEEWGFANGIGLALRLAHTISGSVPGLLARTKLRVTDDTLFLDLPKKGREIFSGDAVGRRLRTLGKAFGLKSEIA